MKLFIQWNATIFFIVLLSASQTIQARVLWSTTIKSDYGYSHYFHNPSKTLVIEREDGGNFLYGLNSLTGAVKWKQPHSGKISQISSYRNMIITLGSGADDLYFWDAKSGKLIKSFDIGNLPTGFGSGTKLIIEGNLLYVGHHNQDLNNFSYFCFNLSTLKLVWKIDHLATALMPTLYEDKIILGVNNFSTKNSHVLALNRFTGALLWHNNQVSVMYENYIYKGKIAFASYETAKLFSLDSHTGSVLWDEFSNSIPLQVSNYRILAGIYNSTLISRFSTFSMDSKILMGTNAENGELLWKYEVNNPSYYLDLVDIDLYKNIFFIQTQINESIVFAINAKTGLQVYELKLPELQQLNCFPKTVKILHLGQNKTAVMGCNLTTGYIIDTFTGAILLDVPEFSGAATEPVLCGNNDSICFAKTNGEIIKYKVP